MTQLIELLKNADVSNPFSFVFLAVFVGAIVRALKSEPVSKLLDRLPPAWLGRIPKDKLPWIACGLGFVIAFADAKLNAKLPWVQALFVGLAGAVLGGGGAIGGNETIAKLLSSFLSSGGDAPKNEPPKVEPPKDSSLQRRRFARVPFLGIATLSLALTACSLFGDPKSATKSFLSVADIVCLETGNGSKITDSKAALIACGIIDVAPDVIDIVEKLIGQREAGKRAGFVWHPAPGVVETTSPTDAGHD